jgi:adenosine deaminase
VRPATLLELARDQRVLMPEDDAEALRDHMRVDDARNLEDYLSRFETTLSVMQTAEAMERIAYELAVDCAAEGVRYLETRYAPILNIRSGLSMGEAVRCRYRHPRPERCCRIRRGPWGSMPASTRKVRPAVTRSCRYGR